MITGGLFLKSKSISVLIKSIKKRNCINFYEQMYSQTIINPIQLSTKYNKLILLYITLNHVINLITIITYSIVLAVKINRFNYKTYFFK